MYRIWSAEQNWWQNCLLEKKYHLIRKKNKLWLTKAGFLCYTIAKERHPGWVSVELLKTENAAGKEFHVKRGIHLW